MPCPRCGARLVTKTQQRPARLICVRCQELLPQSEQVPVWTFLRRHGWGVLVLSCLLLLPVLLTSMSPLLEEAYQDEQSESVERLQSE
ncbi:MAG: hypothetical protein ACO274_10110 [Vulcanococcus sp.]